jgi:hypothetical protein
MNEESKVFDGTACTSIEEIANALVHYDVTTVLTKPEQILQVSTELNNLRKTIVKLTQELYSIK